MANLLKSTINRKKVENYDELVSELVRILRTSNVPKNQIAQRIGLSESQLYRCISGEDKMKPQYIAASFRAVIELCNYQFADKEKPG